MSTLSIRALRADLATTVRRAGAGEATTITVAGRPTARLAPLTEPGGRRGDDPGHPGHPGHGDQTVLV
ncbi:MAG: type II toxin-antitoxin system Phd/YefM family antitoxin, partial [Desertimonas sp.]